MADLSLIFNILAVDRASEVFENIGSASTNLGKVAALAAGAGALAIGAFGVSAIQAGADFDATIRQIGAVTNVPKEQLRGLSELALQFGEDTKFSAGEAADAILELAKGGLTTAQIESGALKETLTLAAAGGIELADAATAVGNGLNVFNLSAGQAGEVAAALAGGANASSASVGDLTAALSQVGPGAANAGLTVQETTAALAAFADAGIRGSDAGTSLKTFLARLVPTTKEAAAEMKALGLNFTDANGQFLPLAEVSEQLRTRLSGLSPAARQAALATIFGSDATRAATVLFNEGAAGIEAYTKATSDSEAANRQAAVATEGTKGAVEQLRGSIETLTIKAGVALGPFIEKAALLGVKLVNAVIPALKVVVSVLSNPIFQAAAVFIGTITLAWNASAIANGLATVALRAYIFSAQFTIGVVAALRGAVTALNLAFRANPIGVVITLLVALGAALVTAYQRSETFRNIVDGAFRVVKAAASAVASFITTTIPAAFSRIVESARERIASVITVMASIPARIKGAVGNLGGLLVSAGGDLLEGLARGITGAIGRVVDAAVGAARAAVNAVKGALGINSPSKVFAGLGVNVVQGFAGGINGSAGLASAAVRDLVDIGGMRLSDGAFVQNRLGIGPDGSTTLPGGGGRSEALLERIASGVESAPRQQLLYTRQGAR